MNKKYRHHSTTEVLQLALKELAPGRIAMVSSFGAESVALPHLLAISDNTVPVLFIDSRVRLPKLWYTKQMAAKSWASKILEFCNLQGKVSRAKTPMVLYDLQARPVL